jgi:predicted metal-dependent phosphotriesterase family hydrolase
MSIRRFDDAVLLCGVPIEDHRMGRDGQDETDWAYVPGNQAYDVPYRTLVPKGREEIWTVGRCFSATHDAHASCRSMAQTMAMGQAAGTAALEQIELLRTLGVDLRHVILSHTDRKPDLAYHRQILSSGVRVEYDSAFRWKPGQPNHTLNLLISLLNEFSKQIMLGMDAARRTYWKQYGGSPGLTFLAGESTHRMRAGGINDDQIRSIFVSTPADAYAFCEGAS